MLFAQGRDLSGQRPDEPKAVCRRAGNEAVVPTIRHSVYGCVLPVHALKVPFLPHDINLTIAPNVPHNRLAMKRSGIAQSELMRLLNKSLISSSLIVSIPFHCDLCSNMTPIRWTTAKKAALYHLLPTYPPAFYRGAAHWTISDPMGKPSASVNYSLAP